MFIFCNFIYIIF